MEGLEFFSHLDIVAFLALSVLVLMKLNEIYAGFTPFSILRNAKIYHSFILLYLSSELLPRQYNTWKLLLSQLKKQIWA